MKTTNHKDVKRGMDRTSGGENLPSTNNIARG